MSKLLTLEELRRIADDHSPYPPADVKAIFDHIQAQAQQLATCWDIISNMEINHAEEIERLKAALKVKEVLDVT